MEWYWFYIVWFLSGIPAAVILYRRQGRFERALDIKYPLAAEYSLTKRDNVSRFLAVISVLGGAVAWFNLAVDTRPIIVGKSIWEKAK